MPQSKALTPGQQSKHFLMLMILVAIGVIAVTKTTHQPMKQIAATGFLAIGYISWGIWHHARQGTLYLHIIVEYVLLAILALAVTVSLISS